MSETATEAVAPPTAGEMIRRLSVVRYRRGFVVPNYKPVGWWECDVFEVTAAGFWREYEVKVSRADFRADAEKHRVAWQTGERTNKHDLLAAGDARGPHRFWYVVPEGMVSPDEVPTWAGLIAFGRHHAGSWLTERTVRDAPKLHREKCPDKVLSHARGICYWRMHDLLNRRTG